MNPTQGADANTGGRQHEPWHIVVTAVLGTAVSASTVGHYGMSLFLKEIARDLVWSRGGVSTMVSFYLVGLGLGLPVAGWLVDWIGPKRTTILSVLILAGSMAGMALGHDHLSMLVLATIMGFGGAATTTLPYVVVIAAHFTKRRGLALAIAATGARVGSATIPIVVNWFLIHQDWRAALVALAGLVLLLALPSAALGLNLPAGQVASRRQGLAQDSSPPPWRQAPFWLIGAAVMLSAMSVGGTIVHAVPLLTDNGIDRTTAAMIVSSMGISGIVGRLGSGYLMDRYYAPYVTTAFYALIVLGTGLILFGHSFWPLVIGYDVIGLALGSESNAVGFLASKYFSRQQHGRVVGLFIAVFTFGDAGGVSALGYSYDLFGTYHIGLLVCMAAGLVASAMATQLRRYGYHENTSII